MSKLLTGFRIPPQDCFLDRHSVIMVHVSVLGVVQVGGVVQKRGRTLLRVGGNTCSCDSMVGYVHTCI